MNVAHVGDVATTDRDIDIGFALVSSVSIKICKVYFWLTKVPLEQSWVTLRLRKYWSRPRSLTKVFYGSTTWSFPATIMSSTIRKEWLHYHINKEGSTVDLTKP